ncbi:helix-turn-helix domain-containing protein [Streptomyces sp. NPDC002537]
MPGPEPLDLHEQRATELGAAIKQRRLAKKWTQAELGKAVALDHTSIAHIEKGTRVPRRDVVARIDKALGVGGAIFRLRDELDDNPDALRVRRFLVQHSRATEIRQICFSSLPAMLETEEHTRLVLEKGIAHYGGDLNDKVAYRRRLRALLDRVDAPTFRAVIWEAALYVEIGDKRIMRRQLLHLIERSQDATVDVRVIPFNAQAHIPDFGFVSMWQKPNGRYEAWRPTGDNVGMFIANDAEIARLKRLYHRLHELTLDSTATRELIHKVVEELYP